MYLQQIEAIERQALAAGDLRRGPAAQQWASAAAAAEASVITRDLYRLELRGDRNNVVYDGLYQMDVAAYRRVDPAGFAIGARPRQGPVYGRFADGISCIARHRLKPGRMRAGLCADVPVSVPSKDRAQHPHAVEHGLRNTTLGAGS